MITLEESVRNTEATLGVEEQIYPELQKTELYEAVCLGDENKVSQLLSEAGFINGRRFDVDERSSIGGNTLLFEAAMKGYVGILNILIHHGADTNARNDYGESALHFAANRHQFNAVEALIEGGADLSIQNNRGNTPLDWVLHSLGCSAHQWDRMIHMTCLLVHAGADVNAGHGFRATPFILLAELPYEEHVVPPQFDTMVLMIKHGANINATGFHDYTILHRAALAGKYGLMLWMISMGADWNIPNDDDQTVFDTLTSPMPQGERRMDTETVIQWYRRRFHLYHPGILLILKTIRAAVYEIPRQHSIMMAATPRAQNSPFHRIPDALIHRIMGLPAEGPIYTRFIWDITLLRLKATRTPTPTPWPV